MKKTVRRGPISQESPEIALEGLLRTELHAFALKAGLMEAGKGFRRVRGYQGMARLSPALERNDERIGGKLKVEEAA